MQKVKDARIRQEKAEEESTELINKAKQLEMELDVYGERLVKQVMAQEAKEAQVTSAEAEFNRLNRRYTSFLSSMVRSGQNQERRRCNCYDKWIFGPVKKSYSIEIFSCILLNLLRSTCFRMILV